MNQSVDKDGILKHNPRTRGHDPFRDPEVFDLAPSIRAFVLVIRLDLRGWTIGDIVSALSEGVHLLKE